MNASFVAYVDESGDEGFQFGDANHSSDWFVLTALIVQKERDFELVRLLRRARAVMDRPMNYTIHFRKLKHEQRVPLVSLIGQARVRTVSVLCHKRSLTETEYLREKQRLYFYSARYLFERISWFCRDNRRKDDPGDGTVEIVFSNRSNLSYEGMKGYMRKLRQSSKIRTDIQVEWSTINLDRITAVPHHLRAGLQAVDAVASSFFYAFERSKYGFTEDKYVRMLLPVLYRRRGKLHGYGVKIWPREKIKEIQRDDRYDWLV